MRSKLLFLILLLPVFQAQAAMVNLLDLTQSGIVEINNGVATLQTGDGAPLAVDTSSYIDVVNGNTFGTVGSALTSYIDLAAGSTISFTYQFITSEILTNNDFAVIAFNGTTDTQLIADTFTAFSSFGDTGLQTFSYILPTNYSSFSIVVSNGGDTANSSTLTVSNIAITAPVPLPSTWYMLASGLVLLRGIGKKPN